MCPVFRTQQPPLVPVHLNILGCRSGTLVIWSRYHGDGGVWSSWRQQPHEYMVSWSHCEAKTAEKVSTHAKIRRS